MKRPSGFAGGPASAGPCSIAAGKQSVTLVLVLAGLAAGLALAPPLERASDSSQRDVIRRASAAYYSLKDRGLLSCQCEVVPDWDGLFQTVKPAAGAQDQLLPLLKQTRFQVTIGPTGASSVSHEAGYPPPNEQVAERLRMEIMSIERLVTGFFEMWSPFSFDSPFPDAQTEFKLEDTAGQYRISYQQGPIAVVTTMAADYALTGMDVKGPQVEVHFHPQWQRVEGLYMLSVIKAEFATGSAAMQQMEAKVAYQDIEGWELPSTLAVKLISPSAHSLNLTFADCRVTKR
jgi:hypothetical protein